MKFFVTPFMYLNTRILIEFLCLESFLNIKAISLSPEIVYGELTRQAMLVSMKEILGWFTILGIIVLLLILTMKYVRPFIRIIPKMKYYQRYVRIRYRLKEFWLYIVVLDESFYGSKNMRSVLAFFEVILNNTNHTILFIYFNSTF